MPLRRAAGLDIKADIKAEAWESLYQTRSRAFAPPANGRIAVKMINHYGDEAMKVYALDGAPMSATT